ncbi:hypothetical protein PRZ48_012296 [Zasmidium cellare]|uniref:SAP domain-containing protein n=1 Tax=Zasmidium cellare TaxID=395010 RepID=A0ABR0E518_ZASCE|nr:hypothetical protein PRZ48_012296 [Zasmidium cellare]
MAAPRATQFIALRNLARGSHQVRNLHMTGPATYASPVLTKAERPVLNLPRDIAGLRAECKRRKIDAAGPKSDLIARLNADELAHNRAFSTIVEKRPTAEQSNESSKAPIRHFNTSREMKQVNDTSTIDFAYLPDVVSPENVDIYSQVRVPILPDLASSSSSYANTAIEPEEVVVMKPEIVSMSADAVYLPMSDLSDGHSLNIDFHAMADRVASNLRRMSVPVEEQAGIMKQIWNDMVDDALNLRKLTP